MLNSHGKYKHITVIKRYCSAKSTHSKRVLFAIVCEHCFLCSAKNTHMKRVFFAIVCKSSKKGKPTKRQPRRDVFPLFPPRAPPFFPFPLLRKRFYARGQKRANKPSNAFSKTAVFWAVAFC